MGMYDPEPNFEDSFSEGDRFILMGMEYVGSIQTRFGPAEKVLLDIVSREHPTKRVKYSAIGRGFAAMAKRAERGDFPHVAEFIRVDLPGGNQVKRFARVEVDPREFLNGDDGPELEPSQLGDALAGGAGSTAPADDDIPF